MTALKLTISNLEREPLSVLECGRPASERALAIASVLMEINSDPDVVAAGLLREVALSGKLSVDQIRQKSEISIEVVDLLRDWCVCKRT